MSTSHVHFTCPCHVSVSCDHVPCPCHVSMSRLYSRGKLVPWIWQRSVWATTIHLLKLTAFFSIRITDSITSYLLNMKTIFTTLSVSDYTCFISRLQDKHCFQILSLEILTYTIFDCHMAEWWDLFPVSLIGIYNIQLAIYNIQLAIYNSNKQLAIYNSNKHLVTPNKHQYLSFVRQHIFLNWWPCRCLSCSTGVGIALACQSIIGTSVYSFMPLVLRELLGAENVTTAMGVVILYRSLAYAATSIATGKFLLH